MESKLETYTQRNASRKNPQEYKNIKEKFRLPKKKIVYDNFYFNLPYIKMLKMVIVEFNLQQN